jgi:ribonuclease P protein component
VAVRRLGRLTSRSAFAELQRSRVRASSGPVRASFVPAEEGAPGVFPQVGYAIGRRCGSAVVRNRLRRRAREVARAEAPALPRGTYLLRVGPAATARPAAEFRADVATALRRAGRVAAVIP